MKRWLAHLGITAYFTALAAGFVGHALDFGTDCHPIMYYLVWDMFCGWSGYEGRMEVIGEGESGKFYKLAPGPWGEFHPYGFISRHHYDPNHMNGFVIANNCLKHTVHEPMVRLFVVEVEYPKKFNIPDAQYEAYYGKPKEFHPYYHTRFIMTPQGEVLTQYDSWFKYEGQLAVADNPRLMADAYRNKPFIASGKQLHAHGAYAPGHFYEPSSSVLSARPPLAE
jgi:hypothetical protein